MTLALYLIVTLLFLFWVIFPMVSAGAAHVQTHDEVDNQERTQALLDSLGELYAKREKIEESDFPNMERRLMLELAKLYHLAGISGDGAAQAAAVGPPADSEFCHRCGKGRDPQFKYCPSCGTGFQAA